MLFVGSFSHGPNEDGIVWFVENVFGVIFKKIPSLKLYVAGSPFLREMENVFRGRIFSLGHLSENRLKIFYRKCKIVIAPLRYGAGIKGRIVEAM